jgi:hypothetical protein
VAGPVPQVAGGREDHDEAPPAVGDLGGEAARLWTATQEVSGPFACSSTAATSSSWWRRVAITCSKPWEPTSARLSSADEPAVGDEGDAADAEALLQVLHH